MARLGQLSDLFAQCFDLGSESGNIGVLVFFHTRDSMLRRRPEDNEDVQRTASYEENLCGVTC